MAENEILIEPFGLRDKLKRPERLNALVVFAHSSGSSRVSPRTMEVAQELNGRRMATFLFNLLTNAIPAQKRLRGEK
jgi:putative phosphoribosyl transferase